MDSPNDCAKGARLNGATEKLTALAKNRRQLVIEKRRPTLGDVADTILSGAVHG